MLRNPNAWGLFVKIRSFLRGYLPYSYFFIAGNPVDYVSSYPHLGHIINASLSDEDVLFHWPREQCAVFSEKMMHQLLNDNIYYDQ
jgi:hypothetical protein